MSGRISDYPALWTMEYTSVNDFPAVKISQAVQNAFCNLPQDFLAGPAPEFLDFLVNTIQASSRAEFHGDRNRAGRLVHKSAVVATDMIRGAVFIKIEFSDNLLLHVGVGVCRDNLPKVLAYCRQQIHWAAHLQRKHGLPILKLAPCDGTSRTFTEAAYLLDLFTLTRR
jgi:hypothetical protein